MYWQAPAAEEMAGTGLKAKHFKAPKVELWPENEPAILLFSQFSTQWRVGMNGPVGLDYGVIFHELDRRELSRDDYNDTMQAVRVIERAALDEMRKD